jgi:hypothetical protein
MQKACSTIESQRQAFVGVANYAEGELRVRDYAIVRFLSQTSNASRDNQKSLSENTSFSSEERPTTPTTEPISNESESESIRQGTNENQADQI